MRRDAANLITLDVEGRRLAARFSLEHIEALATLVMSGYKRSPWGGVEVGGVLFGKEESNGFRILKHRVFESEHLHGPSFELSEKDLERMAQLLASVKTDPGLRDLVPVGWYYSASQRDLSLSQASAAVIDRFFPEPWQVTLVIQRSKRDPVLVGFFFRDRNGSVQTRTQCRFTVDELRGLQSGPEDIRKTLVDESFDGSAAVERSGANLSALGSTPEESATFKSPEPRSISEPPMPVLAAAPYESDAFQAPPPLPIPKPPLTELPFAREESATLKAPDPMIAAPILPVLAAAPLQSEAFKAPPPLPIPKPELPELASDREESATPNAPEQLPISEPLLLALPSVSDASEDFQESEPVPTAEPELHVLASVPDTSAIFDLSEPLQTPESDRSFTSAPDETRELEAPNSLPIAPRELAAPASARESAVFTEPVALPMLEQQLPSLASAPAGSDTFETLLVPDSESRPQEPASPIWEPDESPVDDTPLSPLTFFKLHQDPFSLTPDTSFFYPSPEHNEAIANLSFGIQSRRGFLALTGESGSGKTMVLECVMLKLERQRVDFAYLSHSNISTEEFFELLNYDLDLKCSSPTKVRVLVALNERLIENLREGRITVLFVDNAHKLSVDVLEEVELIGNLETRRAKLIQVVLSGQPDFDEVLEHPRLRGLRQRILARCRIEPLTAQHAADYIEARLRGAGLPNQRVFSEEVLAAIHQRTGGIPRLINAVCSALLAACVERRTKTADLYLLDHVTSELELDHPFG